MIFFFNDTATTEIYTLSLHDALPILHDARATFATPSLGVGPHRIRAIYNGDARHAPSASAVVDQLVQPTLTIDRKSTRLNSSHANISYAVFCLKKKKKKKYTFMPDTV